MKKTFNVTGTCYTDFHYLMDNEAKLNSIMAMIERGEYFTINRPRQYGKTTTMWFLVEQLKVSESYFPIALNFQGVDRMWHENDDKFGQMFVNLLERSLKRTNEELYLILEKKRTVKSLEEVSELITDLMIASKKKIVLLIDEVDASSNYEPFLNFLAMLRNKFLMRMQEPTFYSVVLVGVHDIKNLKFKLRNPNEAQFNSPWNIATTFEVKMEFSPAEIVPMLEQYSEAEKVEMNIPVIAERLYYHTSGYPFLVSKLCKNIAEKILPQKADKTKWTLEDIEQSVKLILKEENTNFESLIKNLENHQNLYDLAYRVLIDGEVIPFSPDAPTAKMGRTYGIFKGNGRLKIHNRIYEQRIYNYMVAKRIEDQKVGAERNLGDQFSDDNGGLDIERVLRKFQSFMKEQRSQKDLQFVERQWRLIFLAFLKPILNGQGHDFKEVETSEEKRLDIVVTYLQYKYILELKLWRGEKAHQNGLNQLADYLDIHGVEKGYLLIFDTRKEMNWDSKMIEHRGKEIYTVWL